MLGHGLMQGTFTTLRGGKFKTGFISGMASKGISAIMRGTSLSQADPFVKMSVTAVLSGMVSEANGGDFVQGAMSAMVVWLYNDAADYLAKQQAKSGGGISDDMELKAVQNAGSYKEIVDGRKIRRTITISASSVAGIGTSVAVFGVKKTTEFIVHIMVNYYAIQHDGRVRYRGTSEYTREKQIIEVSKEGIDKLIKKIITWTPKI